MQFPSFSMRGFELESRVINRRQCENKNLPSPESGRAVDFETVAAGGLLHQRSLVTALGLRRDRSYDLCYDDARRFLPAATVFSLTFFAHSL